MNKDSTTIYIGDIKDDLEQLKKKGYSIKDIIKKGIEYIKTQETIPYNLSELDQSIKELRNQIEIVKQFNLSVVLLNKSLLKLNKTLKKMNKRRKKKKKKGLLGRLVSILYG